MEKQADIPVLILAGGGSRRFGMPKGLARLNGEALIDIVHARLSAQTSAPIALNAPPDGPYANASLQCVPDFHTGQIGPLAGLYTAMHWADEQGYETVITAPVDVPFLPGNFIAQLNAAHAPAIASSQNRTHPVCGLWPVSLRKTLKTQIEDGMRAARDWAASCKATEVHFPPNAAQQDPFFNINTRQDLRTAQSD